MSKYIGMIEKKNNFYNFKPLAEVNGDEIQKLSRSDLDELLPESRTHSISLTYYFYDAEEKDLMLRTFDEQTLVVWDFSVEDDLEENYNTSTGERNQTGYKSSKKAKELVEENKIYSINKVGLYYAIPQEIIKSNFLNDTIVETELDAPSMYSQNVFVEYGEFWAGPYPAMYRDDLGSIVIRPNIKENKYVIKGYNLSNVELICLQNPDNWGHEKSWGLLRPKKGTQVEYQDVISEPSLFKSLAESISKNYIENESVKITDFDKILDNYQNSEYVGKEVPPEIRKSRLDKLKGMLSSETEKDAALKCITNIAVDLLKANPSNPIVEDWINGLLDKHPDFFDSFSKTKVLSNRLEELQNSIDNLESQKNQLNQVLEEKRSQVDTFDVEAEKAKRYEQITEKQEELNDLNHEIEEKSKLLQTASDACSLDAKLIELSRKQDDLNNHQKYLQRETSELEVKFFDIVSNYHKKMVDIAFDGFMSSKMLHAAAEWEAEQNNHELTKLIENVAGIQVAEKNTEETINYLCKLVQKKRPNYKRNTIVNIAICLTQGFLTVFSGEPGCGKTSICNIFGQVLGLNKISSLIADCTPYEKQIVGRYIPVSVERGWTSKRDFIGYYNPLSKSFDKSNKKVYEALHQLDIEKENGLLKIPFYILLDEANLSPMEYYWSDFMNICDDLGDNSFVNLGENYIFKIPETLHFMATINNDHTTETLSPRLIDRAWIITLPQLNKREYNNPISDEPYSPDEIEVISWRSLKNTFCPGNGNVQFPSEIQKNYEIIIDKLREKNFFISPRIDKAIKRYWAVASTLFEEETQTPASTIALDYAIAQRILPKISGSGEEFETWLSDFASICRNIGLDISASRIKDILDRGNQQMKYYQFFC